MLRCRMSDRLILQSSGAVRRDAFEHLMHQMRLARAKSQSHLLLRSSGLDAVAPHVAIRSGQRCKWSPLAARRGSSCGCPRSTMQLCCRRILSSRRADAERCRLVRNDEGLQVLLQHERRLSRHNPLDSRPSVCLDTVSGLHAVMTTIRWTSIGGRNTSL